MHNTIMMLCIPLILMKNINIWFNGRKKYGYFLRTPSTEERLGQINFVIF